LAAVSTIERLRRLAYLAAQAPPTEDALQDAVEGIQHALGAHEVHLVYAEDDEFRWASAADHGVDAVTSQVGLWMIQRRMMDTGGPVGFDIRDRRVGEIIPAERGTRRQWLAVSLPSIGYASEILLVRGPHRTCLPVKTAIFLDTALPSLSLLVSRFLDSERAGRQKRQLNVLSELAYAITQDREMDSVLTRLATTVAVVSEHDYAVIDILKPGSDRELLTRCLNETRFSAGSLVGLWKKWGMERGLDPLFQAAVRSRQPALYHDLQNDPKIAPEMRAFFKQSLLVSAINLPLMFREDVLGVLTLASYGPRSYPSEEVSFLEGMAAQVAATMKAMQTFDELEESRRKLKVAMQEQHRLARTDALTSIPNRRYVEEVLKGQCARAHREGAALSVVLVDADDFKQVNDNFGHKAGDRALIRLARVLGEQCRSMDVVGRYGGDEFIFVLPLADLQQAMGFSDRVRSAVARQLRRVGTGRGIPMTVSLGVAQLRATDRSLDSLLQRSDEALYRAKDLGKDQVCSEELRASAA
jgi:diguanylate cyclase (GGDEF)-like protein